MNTLQHIHSKLEAFIRKFYLNQLLKGTLLFVAIGLLYFLIILFVEHFFWLSTAGRTFLFWFFVLITLALFVKFIVIPLAQLFKLKDGLSQTQAAQIIGTHFTEVDDKLLNLLQLSNEKEQSELLLASIEQKAASLQPIPFTKAINLKQNTKYLKYALFPIVVLLLLLASGNKHVLTNSFNRVVHHNLAFEPPAPFRFYVLNEQLSTVQNTPYSLRVGTEGSVVPQSVSVEINGQSFFMQSLSNGVFEYTFQRPEQSISFKMHANQVASKPYVLEVIQAPKINSFVMHINYPSYTQLSNQTINNTGNVTVPEGTQILWELQTQNTQNAKILFDDKSFDFIKKNELFHFQNKFYNNTSYTLSTSNQKLSNYENLQFSIQVIKDQFPEIYVQSKQDTINSQIVYFQGSISDDYGLSALNLVYYPHEKQQQKRKIAIPFNKGTFDQFLYVFPGAIELEEGVAYNYYFEVFDNDQINGPKRSQSAVYSYRKHTRDEEEQIQLQQQRDAIQGLNSSLQQMHQQQQKLQDLSRIQKEKCELSWTDRQKIESFLQQQQQQEQMLKNFAEQAKENLENFNDNEENDPYKQELLNRFEENQQRQNQNQELLDKLREIQDKISQEELFETLEQINQESRKQQRNLEQLIELTKRYYVERKHQRLNEELSQLADKQEALVKDETHQNSVQEQEQLNKEFEQWQEQMQQLKDDNQELRNPIDLPDMRGLEQEVEQAQSKATQDLKNNKPSEAKQQQQRAAEKMRQMSQESQMSMAGASHDALQEDAQMLRQILSNLIVYSHAQEDLMINFSTTEYASALFGNRLQRQGELIQNFSHIDDSLFALALRNPMIGTRINDLIEEVHYNLDRSTDELVKNRRHTGLSLQQFAITATNDLAVLLDSALQNMQSQMSGSGQGEGGRGFQLPDIIKLQESLSEQMGEGMQSQGQEGSESSEEGSEGQESQPADEGQSGQEGQQGQGNEGNQQGQQGVMQGEQMSAFLFEIYKQQQKLRIELENRLQELGLPTNANALTRQMEQVEQSLLQQGLTPEVQQQMNNIVHQLMQLDQATLQQGEEEQRQAVRNEQVFENQQISLFNNAKNYFNTTEILNREQLPFKPNYQQRVKRYFNQNHD